MFDLKKFIEQDYQPSYERPGYLTSKIEVFAHDMGVKVALVYHWIKTGVIPGRYARRWQAVTGLPPSAVNPHYGRNMKFEQDELPVHKQAGFSLPAQD